MEVYIAPSTSKSFVRREDVLSALGREGLLGIPSAGRVAVDGGSTLWSLSFEGTNVLLRFQESEDRLVFATLEQSMFDDSDVPDRICRALEALGWEVDQESVG